MCRFESCSRHFLKPHGIINGLKEKLMALGLSDEMAMKVIASVADFVKSKIPGSYHGMIDDVLAGKSPELGGIPGSFLQRLPIEAIGSIPMDKA